VRHISEGATVDDLLASYPHLTREGIRAAAAFAADEISHTEPLEVAQSDYRTVLSSSSGSSRFSDRKTPVE
jgi:hypothetical protein